MDRRLERGSDFHEPLLPLRYQPALAEIDALISTATRHPLGLVFLLDGSLDAVAATFGAHAFTVDAARRRLGKLDS